MVCWHVKQKETICENAEDEKVLAFKEDMGTEAYISQIF